MPVPISGLPSATVIHNADVTVFVVSGTTQKATRSLCLTAASAEPITLQGVSSQLVLAASGDSALTNAAGSSLDLAADGSVNIGTPSGKAITLSVGGTVGVTWDGSQLTVTGDAYFGPFVSVSGTLDASGGYSIGGTAGTTATFATGDGRTAVVQGGIITSIA